MELRCKECNTFLGEMLKGSIHKKSCILCEKCMSSFNTYKSLAGQKYGDKPYDMPDFMKDIFGGKI